MAGLFHREEHEPYERQNVVLNMLRNVRRRCRDERGFGRNSVQQPVSIHPRCVAESCASIKSKAALVIDDVVQEVPHAVNRGGASARLRARIQINLGAIAVFGGETTDAEVLAINILKADDAASCQGNRFSVWKCVKQHSMRVGLKL